MVFKSFFQGGFECSTHRRLDGKRIDVVAGSFHDRNAHRDYGLLAREGIRTVRDGIRWHLIERTPYRYDWSSAREQLDAARRHEMQVIWDIFHYGWPDDLDIWSAAFVDRLAALSGAFARLVQDECGDGQFFTPVNEISFMSFAGGEHGFFAPYGLGRGVEMKRQLVRAQIASADAIWAADRTARIVSTDPIINVAPKRSEPHRWNEAKRMHATQFEAWDMIAGRDSPELGGAERYLDIIGVNYYSMNQWEFDGENIPWSPFDPRYRPFRNLLQENFARYRRPILIAETGIEGKVRPDWFRYVCGEASESVAAGVPIAGVCLYPVMNHPGWDDDRHCPNGLLDYDPGTGERFLYEPLAHELRAQSKKLAARAESARKGLQLT